MKDYTTLLEETLEAWAWTRSGIRDEILNLSEGELAFRPVPKARSAAEIVRHIIEVGLLMTGELTRADGSFRRKSYPKLLAEYAGHVGRATTPKRILDWLERSHAEGEKRFRTAGELFLLQYVTRFDGKPGTRLAWLNHGITHEEYHRGQLAIYARLLGKVPALTKAIGG